MVVEEGTVVFFTAYPYFDMGYVLQSLSLARSSKEIHPYRAW